MQYQDGIMHPKYDNLVVELTVEISSIIDEVLEATQELDTIDLINISNITGGPWFKVYKEDDKEHKQIISKEEMYNFYLNRELFDDTTKEEKSEPKKLTLFRKFNKK